MLWYTSLLLLLDLRNAAVLGQFIPSVKSFTPSNSSSSFVVDSSIQIVVESTFADSGSPSLSQFAQTFRSDLVSVTGLDNISDVQTGNAPFTAPTVFLTLGASNATLFNGKPSIEAYQFNISESLYIIKGVEAIGAWWGTRTLLQQIALSMADGSIPASIPAGSGEDSPGWQVRGFMLDAGRHWFETSFLADLCIYASFFKIQEMHLHASDLIWDPSFLYGQDWRQLYTGFRFQPSPDSPIYGLVPQLNESWTKASFTALQTTCAEHGVTIVPEIDTPAHSLVITKWKPELMIQGAPDFLNLSHPDTIPTIKSIWDEVLPWFTSPEVSIGADEYDESLANDYISFVNEMSSYISRTSGKSIRIWGTNEPSPTQTVSTNVTIQHWDFPGGSIPVQLMDRGYSIINSEQAFLYLDGKTSDGDQFPWELNADRIWEGAPGGKGWAPNIFSPTDPSNNTSIDNPLLRGSIMAMWSDWGNNATTPLEVYYQLAKSLALFGEKTWAGSDSDARETGLTRDEFERVYPILNAAAPGQNLNRATGLPASSGSAIVFHYDNISSSSSFPLQTSFESVGPPYTLSFSVKPGPQPQSSSSNTSFSFAPLFSGRDSSLYLDLESNSMTFEDPSTKIRYSLNLGADLLPPGVFSTLEIHATLNYTYALLDASTDSMGGEKLYWTSNLDIWGEYMKLVNMSFAAPSHFIGGFPGEGGGEGWEGWGGELRNVTLRLGD